MAMKKNGGKASLWVFGDSFSTPYNWNPFPLSLKYIESKGYNPPIYSELLSEWFSLSLQTMARGGADNYSIFHTIIQNLDRIKRGDMVIVGWSSITRFRLPNESSDWVSIINTDVDDGFPTELKQSLLIHRLNRYKAYSSEVSDWIRIINKALEGIRVTHWTWSKDNTIGIPIFADLPTIGIKMGKGDEIFDPHYTEEGHLLLAERIRGVIKSDLL